MNIRGKLVDYSPKAFYEKYYKKKLFNKLFAIYLLINVVANFLLFFVLSQNLVTIKYQQTIDMSNQILATVDGLLENKIMNEKTIHQKLMQDTGSWRWIISKLDNTNSNNMDFSAAAYQTIRQIVIKTIHSIDSQINGVFIYSSRTGQLINLADPQSSEPYFNLPDKASLQLSSGSSGTRIISGRLENNHTNSYSLYIQDSVSGLVRE